METDNIQPENALVVTLEELKRRIYEHRPDQLYISEFDKGVFLVAENFKYFETPHTFMMDFDDAEGHRWEMNSVGEMYINLLRHEINENFHCFIFGFKK